MKSYVAVLQSDRLVPYLCVAVSAFDLSILFIFISRVALLLLSRSQLWSNEPTVRQKHSSDSFDADAMKLGHDACIGVTYSNPPIS